MDSVYRQTGTKSPHYCLVALLLTSILLLLIATDSHAGEDRLYGESCSFVNPCGDNLKCVFPFQKCVPSGGIAAPIERCRLNFSAETSARHRSEALASEIRTYGYGGGASAGLTGSVEDGIAYGPNGEFGCYQTLCYGGDVDLNVGSFVTSGYFKKDAWPKLAGKSGVITQGVDIFVAGISTSEVLTDSGEYIGQVISYGIGPDLNPVQVTGMSCNTIFNDLTPYLKGIKTWPKVKNDKAVWAQCEIPVAGDATFGSLTPPVNLQCGHTKLIYDVGNSKIDPIQIPDPANPNQQEKVVPSAILFLENNKRVFLIDDELWISDTAQAMARKVNSLSGVTNIAVSTVGGEELLLATAHSRPGASDRIIFKSTNAGGSWVPLKGGAHIKSGFSVIPRIISRLNAEGYVEQSTDKGESWSLVSDKIQEIQVFGEASPSIAFLTDNGRLFISNDTLGYRFALLQEYDGSTFYSERKFKDTKFDANPVSFKSIAVQGNKLWALSADNDIFSSDNPFLELFVKSACASSLRFKQILALNNALWAIDEKGNDLWIASTSNLRWAKVATHPDNTPVNFNNGPIDYLSTSGGRLVFAMTPQDTGDKFSSGPKSKELYQINGSGRLNEILELTERGIKYKSSLVSSIDSLAMRVPNDVAARAFIQQNRGRLKQLAVASSNHLLSKLFDNKTGNKDEQAIVRLMSELSCPSVTALATEYKITRQKFEREVDGSEWTQLQLILNRTPITAEIPNVVLHDNSADKLNVSANTVNKDTDAREFVRIHIANLHKLRMGGAYSLLKVLFEGKTGNEDEQAIVDIIRALPATQVNLLKTRKSYTCDFYRSDVDGSEWDDLRPILKDKITRPSKACDD